MRRLIIGHVWTQRLTYELPPESSGTLWHGGEWIAEVTDIPFEMSMTSLFGYLQVGSTIPVYFESAGPLIAAIAKDAAGTESISAYGRTSEETATVYYEGTHIDEGSYVPLTFHRGECQCACTVAVILTFVVLSASMLLLLRGKKKRSAKR